MLDETSAGERPKGSGTGLSNRPQRITPNSLGTVPGGKNGTPSVENTQDTYKYKDQKHSHKSHSKSFEKLLREEYPQGYMLPSEEEAKHLNHCEDDKSTAEGRCVARAEYVKVERHRGMHNVTDQAALLAYRCDTVPALNNGSLRPFRSSRCMFPGCRYRFSI